VPFTLKNAALDAKFLQESRGARAFGAAEGPPLGGRHARFDLQRMPPEGVDALVEFLEEFRSKNS
jgi:phosphoserine aminotransferase